MSPDILMFFSLFIERETGIFYDKSSFYQLESRLIEFAEHEGMSGVDELYMAFQGAQRYSLKNKLLDKATNNETFFFRDPSFFLAIKDYLLSHVLPNRPSEIKIWSAASSTGQEAISVAITLDELSREVDLPPYSITATDLSDKVLHKAKSGIYSDFEVKRGLSDEYRAKYFTKGEEGWHVQKSVSSKINYSLNNLTRSTVSGSFHIILCRNVLIYQKVEQKKIIVETLLDQLEPSGALLLGGGETLMTITDVSEAINYRNVSLYRLKKMTSLKAG